MQPTTRIWQNIENNYTDGRHERLFTSAMMAADTDVDEAQCASSLSLLRDKGKIEHVGVLDRNRFVYRIARRRDDPNLEELDRILEQLRHVVIKSLPAKTLIEELAARAENASFS